MKFCGSRARFSRRLLLACLGAALTIFSPQPASAGFLFSYPPNMVTLDSGKRNNVFTVGDPITFTPSIANAASYTLQGPVQYEVRDYGGVVVEQGTTSAPTPTSAPALALRAEPPGWYKLYLHGPTSVAPWGDSVGGTTFVVFRPNASFPAMPDPHVPGNWNVFDGDEVARGVLGMGPQRHPVTDASQPDAAIALLDPSIAQDRQYYTAAPFNDSARPRPLLIAFPNGVGSADPVQQAKNLAGLRQIVAHFHNDVKYWEPLNEPNGQYSGADYIAKELIPFAQAVKSVDPTCKVLGPAVVTIGPYGLNWLDGFLKAGGASYIDAFSFHAYNNVNGDLMLARKSLDALQALLTQYNIPNIEKWQTEQGYMAAVYGSYQPRLQGRWTMLQMMVYEQYGIPKEHNHLWYDKSHGDWSVPMFWENEDGPYSAGGFDPAAPLMRVWSEELYGTNFAQAYDFGALGNKMYVGSLFGGAGKQVAAFMSAGKTDGQVTLNVTGGASVHVVSAFGVATDLPVAAGRVTLPVPELPVYVELAPGQALQVAPLDYGPDLAQTPGTTALASGSGASPLDPSFPNDSAKVIDGTLENWYWNQGPGDHPWMSNVTAFPATIQVTLPQPMSISHVVLYAGVPWQNDGSLLDYELQYDSGGQWVTLSHVQEPANVVPFFTPTVFTTVDSFYSDRCVFQHDFPAVTTQKVRLLVHDATWGGGVTQDVVQAGGQTGPHQVTLREIELYGPAGQAAPTQQGRLRFFPRLHSPDRMVGGRFQGSTDGVSYSTLDTVTSIPADGQWTEVPLYVDPKTYRFLRYLAPDGSYGNIAEMEFYSGVGASSVKLTGIPFGSPGSFAGSGNGFANAVDGNTGTYFDGPGPNGNFAGIDQGAAAVPTVTGVSVSPGSATVAGGQAQQFGAFVSGTNGPSQAVTWVSSAGAVDGTGLFTAPASASSAQTVTVTATSVADGTKSASAAVTVPAAAPPSAGTGQVRFFPRPTCASRMVGGRFQGSLDGVTYADLYTIPGVPADGQWTTAPLPSDPRGYRFLRYLSPDGGWGNVAEVEFDSGAGASAVKLTGIPFGSPGSFAGSGNTYANVFDGNTGTYFDAPGPSGDFAGIDQGGSGPAPVVTGVSVSPGSATVAGGQAQQFGATVAGTGGPSQAVTWAASAGAVTAGGLFTAPASASSAQTVTVTATSVADATKSATATVTVPAATGAGTGQVRFFPRPGSPDRMRGGRFQGSLDGVTYVDLYTIPGVPADGQWTVAPLPSDPKAYRFLRYLSPDGGWGNVAEVEFYSGVGTSSVKLTGTPFGTPGSFVNSGNTFDKVFDGNTGTYFDAPGPNGDFAGIDQGGSGPAPVVTGVSVSPGSATVAGGQAQQFGATVAGTGGPPQAVTWATSAGAVTAGGLFTAPAASSSAQTVTVTATSVADATKSASAAVTVPAAATGAGGGQVRFFPRPTCASRMVGGRFQGSLDGVTYADLYTIPGVPADGQWTTAPLPSDPRGYRFLRYLSPDGGWGNVAEVEFDSGAGASAVKLTGIPFGSPGSYAGSGNGFANAVDGNTGTYFDGPGPNGNFAGIDQGGAGVVVTGVSVSPPSATVAGGQAQRFIAVVSGTNGPSQAVTWVSSAGAVDGTGLFTAPASASSAQTVTVTATSAADATKSATATVTVPAAATGAGVLKIGFLGDSITYGIGDNGGPDAYDLALTGLSQNGYQVTGVNYGNNGASVTSFYQQTAGPIQAFESAGVSVVSIMLGTNDASTGTHTSPQDYHDKLLEIVNSFLAPGTGIQKVILNYSPYIQPNHPAAWDSNSDAELLSYQPQIDSLCNGTTILQGDKMAYQFFQQHPEQGDGVHPNPQGHQDLGRLWAIGITDALGGTNTLPYPTGTGTTAP